MDRIVIDSSFNHIVNVDLAPIKGETKKFLHCQVMTWNRETKERLQGLLDKLGECYVVAYPEVVKFNEMMGARIIQDHTDHNPPFYLMRYN